MLSRKYMVLKTLKVYKRYTQILKRIHVTEIKIVKIYLCNFVSVCSCI